MAPDEGRRRRLAPNTASNPGPVASSPSSALRALLRFASTAARWLRRRNRALAYHRLRRTIPARTGRFSPSKPMVSQTPEPRAGVKVSTGTGGAGEER